MAAPIPRTCPVCEKQFVNLTLHYRKTHWTDRAIVYRTIYNHTTREKRYWISSIEYNDRSYRPSMIECGEDDDERLKLYAFDLGVVSVYGKRFLWITFDTIVGVITHIDIQYYDTRKGDSLKDVRNDYDTQKSKDLLIPQTPAGWNIALMR